MLRPHLPMAVNNGEPAECGVRETRCSTTENLIFRIIEHGGTLKISKISIHPPRYTYSCVLFINPNKHIIVCNLLVIIKIT